MTEQCSLTVAMPLPAVLLTRNLRLHWRVERQHGREQRQMAWAHTLAAAPLPTFAGRIRLDVEIRPRKGMRRLDDDNAWTAMKHVRDGLADALGINDQRFVSGALVWSDERTGQLVIRLTEEDEHE